MVVVREQPSVEQGEMCAALIEGEATVKFFRRTSRRRGVPRPRQRVLRADPGALRAGRHRDGQGRHGPAQRALRPRSATGHPPSADVAGIGRCKDVSGQHDAAAVADRRGPGGRRDGRGRRHARLAGRRGARRRGGHADAAVGQRRAGRARPAPTGARGRRRRCGRRLVRADGGHRRVRPQPRPCRADLLLECRRRERRLVAAAAHPPRRGPGAQVVEELHHELLHSPGHRRNLLAAEVDEIGIGIHVEPNGDVWITQNFRASAR
jgi:hypothetical protein